VLERLAALGWRGELVIAGGAPPGSDEGKRLRARAAASPEASRIRLHGPTARVGELLASARFCLITSRHEGFGRVAVEAMHLGTPVAAIAAGAMPEIVQDGESGVLAEDAQALAERMLPYLREPARWQALSEGARRRAQAFTPERMIAALGRLYAEIGG